MNHFGFWMSESVFICLPFSKIFLPGVGFWVHRLFVLSILWRYCHTISFLFCFPGQIHCHLYLCYSVYNSSFFLWLFLRCFSPSRLLGNLVIMCLDVVFLHFSCAWSSVKFLVLVNLYFSSNSACFQPIFLSWSVRFSATHTSPLFLWFQACILDQLNCPIALFLYFFFLFLFFVFPFG